ncbi:hypothetical protein [Pauljensenia sp. OF14-1SRA]|uniref:hypothetical protein n=1 Tax=Pauljensenia sp. OF14-1SRA TaxID=2998062 RepID=UPI0022E7A34E|nr:hypothetical protein [Pauljensenia sp. OF14-1SRA]
MNTPDTKMPFASGAAKGEELEHLEGQVLMNHRSSRHGWVRRRISMICAPYVYRGRKLQPQTLPGVNVRVSGRLFQRIAKELSGVE